MRGIVVTAAVLLIGGFSTAAWSQDAAPVEFTVSESAAPGTVVGRLGAAADPESPAPRATYDFAAGNATPFLIDPQTGELTLGKAGLDYELRSRYELTIRIRTPKSLDAARRAYIADLLNSGVEPEALDALLYDTAERSAAVLVADAPEAPQLAADQVTLVVRDATAGAQAQLAVRDPDAGDTHSFELIAGDGERFQIDPQTGSLAWRPAAGAHGGSFPLTVRVTDSTGLSDAATFNVEVIVPRPAVAAATPVAPSEPAAQPVAPREAAPAGVRSEPREPSPPQSATAAVPAAPRGASRPVPTTPLPENSPRLLREPRPGDVVANEPTSPPPAASADESQQSATLPTAPPPVAAEPSPPLVEQVPAPRTRVASWGILGWFAVVVPPVVAVVAVAVVVLMVRRNRQPEEPDPVQSAFRVVREARMLTAATATLHRGPALAEEAAAGAGIEAMDADKAAVHQLIAAAFQQTTGPQTPTPSQAAPAEQPVAAEEEPTPVEIHMPVLPARAHEPQATIERLVVIEDGGEEYVEPVVQSVEVDAAPLNAAAFPDEPCISHSTPWSVEREEPAPEANPLDGTDQFVMPEPVYDEVGVPTREPSTHDWTPLPAAPAAPPAATDDQGCYDTCDDDLSGSYYGLRLSQSCEPAAESAALPAECDPYPLSMDSPMPMAEDPGPAGAAEDSPVNDEVLALRRQLSDLFGVPADRPAPRPVDPMENLSRTFDFQEIAAEVVEEPVVPVEPEPAAEAAPAVEAAFDPVRSWQEYLKQRSLESAGPAAVSAAPALPPSPPPPPPAPTCVAPPPAPPAAATGAPWSTPAAAARVDKSAVREEISMLRSVANQHSRNVLARRASHQRARFTWVAWGTALVALCFVGLTAIKHEAAAIRSMGWLLFAGAGVALIGCLYGFRGLSSLTAQSNDDELEAGVSGDDFGQSVAPELMTPEMEARLREVMDAAEETPVAAGTQDA